MLKFRPFNIQHAFFISHLTGYPYTQVSPHGISFVCQNPTDVSELLLILMNRFYFNRTAGAIIMCIAYGYERRRILLWPSLMRQPTNFLFQLLQEVSWSTSFPPVRIFYANLRNAPPIMLGQCDTYLLGSWAQVSSEQPHSGPRRSLTRLSNHMNLSSKKW